MLDVATGQTSQVAAHDQPIRCVETIQVQGSNMLVTGSWDKTIKYWDLRQSQPAMTLQCQDRVYCMDIRDQMLVVGTADRYVNVVNLSNPGSLYKTIQSPLKWQTRTVSCFTDTMGYAVGSIEGRCAIQYVEEKDQRSVNTSPISYGCHEKPVLTTIPALTSPSNATARTCPTPATAPTSTA
jgi:mRNA export factor